MKKKPKNPDAVRLAKKRAASLSPERRSAIARHAANVRWQRYSDNAMIGSSRGGAGQ